MKTGPEHALHYAQTLAFPRRVGTDGEARATEFVADRLADFGYEVTYQPFECSTGADTAFALLIGLGQVLTVLTFWAYSGPAWLAVLPAAGLAGLLLGANRLSRWAAAAVLDPKAGVWQRGLGRLGRRYTTSNIIGELPFAAPGQPHLIVVAHWDSKSQALPLLVRMGLLAIAGGAGLAFAVLTVARLALPAVTGAAALCGLLALVAAVPVLLLYLQGSGNASPGAVDNASGLGLLLSLADFYGAAPPGPINLTFVATGAEEFGLMGATAFARSLQDDPDWDPAHLHILNLDGVGTAGRLAYVGAESAPLVGRVRAAAAALGIPVGRLPLIGAMYDHLPFADAGLDALTLVTTGQAARFAHTAADSADKLDLDGLDRAGRVVIEVVRQLAAESGQG